MLHSLFAKLSLLFIALVLLISAVDIYSVTQTSKRFVDETTQRANLGLAQSIAREMHVDTVTGQIEAVGMNQLFMSAMTINPIVKLFVVDLNGKMIASSAKPEATKLQAVAAQPIRDLLDGKKPLPIYNDDPRNPGDPKIFSVAPLLKPDGSPLAYLYITIGTNDQLDLASVRHSYILSALLRSLAIAAAVVLVAGLVLIYLLTRHVRQLNTAVRQVQEGDFSARVAVQSSDEIGQLGTAFNSMAAKIESSLDTLSRNDSLRRELVANISHDLRTPLASIEGYTETILLREHVLTEIERKTYLQTILKNTQSLGRLVSELFELSKLEAKQTTLQIEPFSITELIQDNLLKFEPQANEQAIQLASDLPRHTPFVLADVALIERVLQNIIANALQYTPQQGRVSISVWPIMEASQVRVSVADTGRGITPEDMPHIFDRFYRSGPMREKARLGLGLAIAHRIVHLHNSQIDVQSTPNVGTTFSFQLPIYN
ncbi:sensor histidine kinase [Fibrella sp. HMF5335]|uniref:histidine kinase n=1 Tax=Fibrella rubiginis TaxID=2817060 RepID=A0A939K1M4_9BACT|nr:sensor histidine kinase [Fibrella rubiginis]MBO0937297.1 sensor histidine kinase [Fibrella rubiginis]